MPEKQLFTILDSVDSTNNYAMGQAHAALAAHGQAWFAKDQYMGKGQRGKSWLSAPGENLILSIVLRPNVAFAARPFLFNAFITNICHRFFSGCTGSDLKIKWPNDLYWRDRKTGGILIENIYKGKQWEWAIAGFGINVNQNIFDESLLKVTSLRLITGKMYDPILLAKELHHRILEDITLLSMESLPDIMDYYNEHLYKKNETCRLKKSNAVFETNIQGVNNYGQLITRDTLERTFEFGEITWLL